MALGSIRLSVWVGTYLGQLRMTLDNNNNNIHSFDGGGGCSIGSRYVNVRRDLPRLLFFVPYFFAKYTNSSCRGFSKIHSVFHNLRSISGAFFSSLDLTDDDDHYFTQ